MQANIRAANANEDTVDIAVMQLVLSLVGIGGVGWTVYYAHMAWREAAKSADAAHATLDQSKRDSAASRRAWVKIDEVSLFPGTLLTTEESRMVVAYRATNVGVSPATNVKIDVQFAEADEFLSTRDGIIARNRGLLRNGYPGSILFPDDPTYQTMTDLTHEGPWRISEHGKINLILFLYAFYKSPGSDEVHGTINYYSVYNIVPPFVPQQPIPLEPKGYSNGGYVD